MALTIKARLIAALQARGSAIVPNARSSKYVTLTRPIKPGTFFFVGVSGALRAGRTASLSVSCNDRFKNWLLGLDLSKPLPPSPGRDFKEGIDGD